MRKRRRSHYTFALYGLTGTGKTCMLGMMALGAPGDGRGLTCQLMPVTVPKPIETPGRRLTEEERTNRALHAGREWIDTAAEALGRNDIPPPNDPEFEPGGSLAVEFNIGSPDRGDFLVRTIDYSGELIHPKEEYREDTGVRELKKCLKDFDGLLIIAETPKPGGDQSEIQPNLRSLKEAFISMREEDEFAAETPVAIVFTKWDRCSTIEVDRPEAETQKLMKFRRSHPSHWELVNAVHNALVEQSDEPGPQEPFEHGGVGVGNCMVFPASAFRGKTTEDGREVPTGDHQTYGLLGPFVWMADRRDLLDSTSLKERSAARGFLRSIFHAGIGWNCQLARDARRIKKRMPRKATARKTVSRIANKSTGRVVAIGCVRLLLFFALIDLAWEGYVKFDFDRKTSDALSTQTGDPERKKLGEWFENYGTRYTGVLFAPGVKDATEVVVEINRKRESLYGDPLVGAITSQDRHLMFRAAQTYLKELPAGDLAPKAQGIIDRNEPLIRREQNEAVLAGLESRAADVHKLNTATLKTLRKDSEAPFKRRQDLTGSQLERWQKLIEVVRREISKRQRSVSQGDFQKEYFGLLQNNDFLIATEHLNTWQTKDDGFWKPIVSQHPKKVLDKTITAVKKHLTNNERYESYQVLDLAKSSMEFLEKVLGSSKGMSKEADNCSGATRTLDKYKQYVMKMHDYFLYSNVFAVPSERNCNHYLKEMPAANQDRMGGVTAYLAKLKSIPNTKVNLSITASIIWGTYKDSANDHRLEMNIDNVRQDDTKDFKVEKGLTFPYTVNNAVLSGSFKSRIELIEDDGLFGLDKLGFGTSTIPVVTLLTASGVKVNLDTPAKNDKGITVILRAKRPAAWTLPKLPRVGKLPPRPAGLGNTGGAK